MSWPIVSTQINNPMIGVNNKEKDGKLSFNPPPHKGDYTFKKCIFLNVAI